MFGLAADRGLLEYVISRVDPRVAHALTRALEGREPSFDDGLALASAKGAELDALILTADYLRRQVGGDVVSYIVNRNINFTNVCSVGCAFCAFSTPPTRSSHAEPERAWHSTLAEVAAKAEEAWAHGATEVCIQGGINPEDDPYLYRDIILAVRQAVPEMHIHAFSPLEILTGARKTRMNFRDYLQMLKDAGLGTIPGTAAEILVDEVRRQISPLKLPRDTWVEIVKTAHSLGIRSSSTMMYGHIEAPHHWVEHVMLLREIQKETGGFTEFVPLGFIHHNTELYRSGKSRPGATLEEDLRVTAFGRVMLHGLIDNVQVSWVKQGHKLALLCLQAGGNDFGGTLMEESISRLAGASFGEVTWPHEMRRYIRSIGRVPAVRDTTYSRITLDQGPDAEPMELPVLNEQVSGV